MYLKIGDYEMYYEVSGNPNGDWLVLLHGISGSTRCWKYQINELNKHFRVLNLDMAGHGKSTAPNTKKYSGMIVANHIRLLMDELGIEKAHILGLSLGTIVQQYFSELFPERVKSMIFASPISKPNYLSTIMNGFAEKIFLKLFSKNTYLKLMATMMLPGKSHEKSRKFFLQETYNMKDEEFMKWWKVVTQGDHYFFLSQSDIPALIAVGEKDFCFYNDAVALKEKYNDCEFKVIKDAGHVFIFQKAEEFNKMVVNFIDSLDERYSEEEYEGELRTA